MLVYKYFLNNYNFTDLKLIIIRIIVKDFEIFGSVHPTVLFGIMSELSYQM